MIDLDPKAQALLDSIRDADGPTRREKARVKKRVLARVAGVVLAVSAGTSSATAASIGTAVAGAWSGKMVVLAIAASTLAAGSAATGVVVWHQHTRHPAAPTAPAPGPRFPSAPTTTSPLLAPIPKVLAAPPATEQTSPAPRVLDARPAAAPMERPAAIRATLEEELPFLQSAQEALRLGDTDRALSLLDAHAKRFPAGALSEERRAAHALATCRKTGGPLSRAEGQAFLRDSPSSPLSESVRKACLLSEQ